MLPGKKLKLKKAVDTTLSPKWREAWAKFYREQEAFAVKLSRKFFPYRKVK